MGFEEPTSDPYNIVSKVKEHYCKIKVDQESKKHLPLRCFDEKKNVYFLRQKIQKLREVNFPNQITVEARHYGQCPDVPTELSDFYRNLFTGSKN